LQLCAVVGAELIQILRLTDDVMILLVCQTSSPSSSSSSSSTFCSAADSSAVKLYGRPGVELDNDSLRHLVLDVRVTTLSCVQTQHLRTAARNGPFVFIIALCTHSAWTPITDLPFAKTILEYVKYCRYRIETDTGSFIPTRLYVVTSSS